MNRRDLTNDLWHACDIMRRDDGTTGVLQYMEQLSWLMFLKIFEAIEERLQAESEFAGRPYDAIIEKKYRWSSWAKQDWRADELVKFINDELIPHLRSLTGSPEREIVSTIFKEGSGNLMKSGFNLKEVISIVDEIDFNSVEDSHVVSQMYEELLLRMGKEGGVAGEFYTPRPIVRLMVRIVSPEPGERTYDPFCGSCGFLVESFRHIQTLRQLSIQEYEKLQRDTFYGQEKKPVPYLLGVMNCILHGLLTPQVVRRNTLEENIRNIPESQRFDIVITNPPFGGKENKQIQQNFPIQIDRTELLSLQYVMKKVRNNGRAAIVVPESTLSSGGAFTKVRKELVEEFNVHTIVSLPQGVFANVTTSGQGPKTNLVFFERNGKTKRIWYYELLPPEGVSYTKSNPVKDEDLLECWKNWQAETISSRSWLVSVEDIRNNRYDLTAKNPVSREIAFVDSPENLLLAVMQNHRRSAEVLDEISNLLGKSFPTEEVAEVPMSQLLSLRRDPFEIQDEVEYKRVTVQLHARGIVERDSVMGSDIKMKKQQKIKADDLIVAEIDAKVGGFGIVPPSLEGAVVSSHYFVYSIDTSRLLPKYLAFYLRTGKPTLDIQAFVKGSLNYASIRPNHFLELSIPLPSLESQRKIVDLFSKVEEMADSGQEGQSLIESLMKSIYRRVLSMTGPRASDKSEPAALLSFGQ
jgi:type I restriction enzyme M protein